MKALKLFCKKYKAKLRFKQPIWYQYLAIPLLGLVLIGICFALDYTLDNSFLKINVPQSIFIYLAIGTFIATFITWYISPLSFSKVQRTKRILKKIIEENKFYYANSETNKIHSSMLIKFYWDKNDLILNIYPLGGKYAAKMNELTVIFQTAFNMTVVTVQDDYADHTTYVLSNTVNNYIDSTDSWTV